MSIWGSNVHQDIVNQAQGDPLLQAAMRGDPQARAQILAFLQQDATPFNQQFIAYQEAHGGLSPQDLSKLYLQKKTGNAQSPVYYDPTSGGYKDFQKDSPWFKIAQYAPGIVGGGLALAGAAGAGPMAAQKGIGSATGEGSGEPNWDTYGDQWWYDDNGNIVGDAGIGTGHGQGEGGQSEGSSVSGQAGGVGSAIGNALKRALPALIAGGVGLGGRALAGGGFGSGVPPPPPIPPELQQLLAQAMQRVGAQQPIVNAVNKQTLAGLPAYTKG